MPAFATIPELAVLAKQEKATPYHDANWNTPGDPLKEAVDILAQEYDNSNINRAGACAHAPGVVYMVPTNLVPAVTKLVGQIETVESGGAGGGNNGTGGTLPGGTPAGAAPVGGTPSRGPARSRRHQRRAREIAEDQQTGAVDRISTILREHPAPPAVSATNRVPIRASRKGPADTTIAKTVPGRACRPDVSATRQHPSQAQKT